MKPVDIPDDKIVDGFKRVTIGAPKGAEVQVRPVEALVALPGEEANILLRIELEEIDVEAVSRGERHFWFRFMGHTLVPFSVGDVGGA